MEPSRKKADLPPIPAKRYFTIGEVSELCGVKPHVLRYWEQEFTQLKPVKRRGCFLRAIAFGLPPASRWRSHSARPQFQTRRAVPAARAK